MRVLFCLCVCASSDMRNLKLCSEKAYYKMRCLYFDHATKRADGII